MKREIALTVPQKRPHTSTMSFARNQAPAAWGLVPAIEQWQRVQRWESRLRKLDADVGVDPDDLFDFAIAVAQNTFAMRDWLLRSLPNRKDEISELFKAPRLQLLRDLVNGSKHLALDPKKVSVDGDHAVLKVHAPKEPRGWVLTVLHRGYSPDRAVEWIGGHDADGEPLSGTALVPLALSSVKDVADFMDTVARARTVGSSEGH